MGALILTPSAAGVGVVNYPVSVVEIGQVLDKCGNYATPHLSNDLAEAPKDEVDIAVCDGCSTCLVKPGFKHLRG